MERESALQVSACLLAAVAAALCSGHSPAHTHLRRSPHNLLYGHHTDKRFTTPARALLIIAVAPSLLHP